MIGEQLKPIYLSIENMLLMNYETKPDFDNETFRAAIYIFQSALMDKLYDLQNEEEMDFENRTKMVKQCGKDLRNLIKNYTNIDTFDTF